LTHQADAYGARVKVRDIWVVVLLTVVTLGIYSFFWYYYLNRELRDFGRVYQDPELAKEDPAVSVLAVTLGSLVIVPALVSYWRTTGRIRRAQRIVGSELTNGWVIFGCYVGGVLFVLPFLAIPGYVQSGLNSVWERYPRVAEQVPLPPGQGTHGPVGAPGGAGVVASAQPAPQGDLPPAGWYEDPSRVRRLRYWDGAAWTEHTAD
jgi:hypothetical protein